MKYSPETSTSDTAHLPQPETIFMEPNTNLLTTPSGSHLNAAQTPTNLTVVDDRSRRSDTSAKPVLTAEDRDYLATRVRRITGSIKASIAAAKDFYEISIYKDGLLWKATHDSFADYCLDRWGYAKAHSYRLVASGEIIHELESRAAENKLSKGDQMPISETHLRPLQKLRRDRRADCWSAIVADNKPEDLTEKLVAAQTATYAASIGTPITLPKAEPPSATVKAKACLEKLRTAIEVLPVAAAIEELLTRVEALLA